MFLRLNEQEVKDGCCVAANEQHGIPLEEVEIQLHFDEKHGFFATAWNGNRTFRINHNLAHQQMIDGISLFLNKFHSFNIEDMRLELLFNPEVGIYAEVYINE